jgi:signal transduction histidine kinase
MTLRAKLIALFAVLGVAPIVALGLFNYIRSIHALEELIASRTAAIAERAAEEVADRYALRQSDLLLLAENAETQRLHRAHLAGDGEETGAAYAAADAYLRRAWQVINPSYRRVEFLDTAGVILYTLGVGRMELDRVELGSELYDIITVMQPIRDIESAQEIGTLVAVVRTRALLPENALATSFGRTGYSVVVDRSGERVLHHPRRAFLRQHVSALLGPEGWHVDAGRFSNERGSITYEEDGIQRVASFVSLSTPPWTVLSSASVDEFAPPFTRTRLVNLILMLLVAAVISLAFILTTRRMTRSLKSLTAAADQVAAGDFAPNLPSPGADEVGKLSAAFGMMVEQVRDMLRRVQESRHLAAVGQFASQLSHEIRNPLTSIKLNLQSLERDVAGGRIPEESARPVEICLREVSRLDRVVRGVLNVARTREPVREPWSVHSAVAEALEVLRPQLEEQRIAVREDLRASDDIVRGDAEQLKGVFLNLFLNAAEAMPDGGTLRIATESRKATGELGARAVRVRVADEGPGVPPELREKIFEPFFSTKAEGTGFGLVLAQHAVEEHSGRLTLEENEVGQVGAVFVVELPLSTEGQAS